MSATTAVVRTEARLFGRELGALFWIIFFPTILLGIIGSIPSFRVPDESLGGARAVDLYASVSVLLAVIMASLMAMPSVLMTYREQGILRRLRTTPVHPGSLLAAQVALHAAAVLVAVVLALGFARLVHDVPLPGSLGWYALSLLLTIVASFAVGAVLTSAVSTTRGGQAIGTMVMIPMMFTAGTWLPVQAMPDRLREIVVLTPLGAGAEALNDTLLGRAPHLGDLLVTGGWAIALALLAVRIFRWE